MNNLNKSIEDDSKKVHYWIDEYQSGQRYGLEGKVLLTKENHIQKITIVDTKKFGKGLLLDNCWMTAEYQDQYYHECLVHPAMSSAKDIEKVLIIGGGDGGTAKECLRYKEIKHLDLVEIDSDVIELSQHFLPSIGGTAWKDPRLHIAIQDGTLWVANSLNNYYDVIIIDGSDPKGAAKGLFTKSFLQDCNRILKCHGTFAAQTESPESFFDIHIETIKTIRDVFTFANPLYGCVPIYPSGWWSWTFAAKDSPRYLHPMSKRAEFISKNCKIWNPRWQKGAFQAIPTFIEKELKQ